MYTCALCPQQRGYACVRVHAVALPVCVYVYSNVIHIHTGLCTVMFISTFHSLDSCVRCPVCVAICTQAAVSVSILCLVCVNIMGSQRAAYTGTLVVCTPSCVQSCHCVCMCSLYRLCSVLFVQCIVLSSVHTHTLSTYSHMAICVLTASHSSFPHTYARVLCVSVLLYNPYHTLHIRAYSDDSMHSLLFCSHCARVRWQATILSTVLCTHMCSSLIHISVSASVVTVIVLLVRVRVCMAVVFPALPVPPFLCLE